MIFKGNFVEGEVFVVASNLLNAVQQVDKGVIFEAMGDAQERADQNWPDKVYRVEVKIYEA